MSMWLRIALVSLVMSLIKPGRGEEEGKKDLHLIKHTIVHRWQAGEDIIMTITAAIKNVGAAGRESAVQNGQQKSQSVIFLGPGPITDLSHIKAGQQLAYGFSAHAAHEAYIGRTPQREVFIFLFFYFLWCASTHVENISVTNRQRDLTKKLLGEKIPPPFWKSSNKPIPSIYYRRAKCICGCRSV